MKNMLVSIIIPAYNTSKYIEQMLQSVVNQTFKNLEIIVINDGSKDNTLEIIEYYAKKDNRFTVIDLPNGGVSNARNVGLKICRGDKIFFWDSDDVIELDAIEKCLQYSDSHHVNSVIYGYSSRNKGVNGIPHKSNLKGDYRRENIREKVLPCFIGHSFEDINLWIANRRGLRDGKENNALWHVMCDGDTIRKNNIFFDTNLSLGEDTRFINEYLLYEQSIGYLDNCLYHLTHRESGANMQSIKDIHRRLRDKIKLIYVRQNIDRLAYDLYGINTHQYWEGTMVLSSIEMALRLAKDGGKRKTNIAAYREFMKIESVHKACIDFLPVHGVKSVPFRILLKDEMVLYYLFELIPKFLTCKFVYY